MDYFTWSQEYYRDAENLLKTIRKYELMLKEGHINNLEKINSTIAKYRGIYYDVLNTARMLEERALVQSNAA